MDKKVAQILLGIGVGLALLICFISVALYGKVYFFDGYEITKIAWIVSAGFTACGLIGLIGKGEAWAIGIIVVLIIVLVASCSGSGNKSSSSSGSSSGTRCNNCGGDGWDSANSCSCVWCGGDGRTSWNP